MRYFSGLISSAFATSISLILVFAAFTSQEMSGPQGAGLLVSSAYCGFVAYALYDWAGYYDQ